MATQAPEIENGGAGGGFVSSLPAMLWQRRWFVILPVMVATIAGLVTAFLMHPVYESSATVLIESQQVPDDLISALSGGGGNQVSDMIGQRIARARERVLSRQDLIRLIRTYGLYPREQRTLPLSKIVDKMRDDTTIQAIDNGLAMGAAPSRKNLGLANTIAITVSYEYDDPVKAQLVAQQFVDHFLEADASTQVSQATDTVNFLTEQANQIQAQIAQLEQRATEIRSQNGAILALNGLSGNAGADGSQIQAQIAAIQAQNMKLEAAQENGGLQNQSVAQAEAQLRVAQAKFSDTHPDVIAAKAQLEAAKRAAGAKIQSDPIKAQMQANQAQIAALNQARAMAASNSASYRAAAARAPALAAQLDQLEKAADVLRDQYRGIGVKLQAAQIQARMESEQKGERLTLSDPPVVPDHPLRPNRPLIIAGSIAGGFGLGLGLVLLIELVMRPIRGTAALRRVTGEAPLAVIPDFDLRPSWIAQMIERRVRRKSNAAVRA
jgi:polysaccharide biosynthesis transport protein